jgi:hypothetical protein
MSQQLCWQIFLEALECLLNMPTVPSNVFPKKEQVQRRTFSPNWQLTQSIHYKHFVSQDAYHKNDKSTNNVNVLDNGNSRGSVQQKFIVTKIQTQLYSTGLQNCMDIPICRNICGQIEQICEVHEFASLLHLWFTWTLKTRQNQSTINDESWYAMAW